MKKKIFYLLLLCLMVLGRGEVWADATYEYKYSPELNTNNYFTVSSTSNFSGFPSNTVQVDGSYITGATKMGGTVVTFETTAASSTVYVGIYIRENNINTFKFDYVDKSLGTSGSAAQGDYGLVQIDNVGYGQHRIEKKTGNEVELYYVKVVEHNSSYPDATVQTYPHTWDFTKSSADWGTTSTQVVNYDDWDGSGTYFHTGTAGTTRGFNIDVLKGLRCQSYWLGVDWGYGHIYATAGSITIPSVPANYRIVFTMEGREGELATGTATTMTTSQATPASATITRSDGNHTTYTFDVTSAGDVTFNFDGAISVKSIKVTSSTFTGVYSPTTTNDLNVGTYDADKGGWVIDDNVRNLSGTYTFTGAGAIDSGTEIEEVPGIKMTLGKIGSEYAWAVNSSLKATIPSLAGTAGAAVTRDQYDHYNPTDKAFLKFEPYVNGYLTMNGTWYGGVNGSTKGVFQKSDGTELRTITATSTSDDITVVLEAGATYYFYCQNYPLQIHSFTFRPAFLEVDQTTGNLLYTLDENNNRIYTEASKDISDPYKSDLSKDPTRFPRLIQSANNYVKFADKPVTSEIEHLVNIATNNDVTLLENGKTLMKGTVSCAIPGRELFTYYYLQSNILTLYKTYRLKNGSSTPIEIENEDYVLKEDIEYGEYQFEFSGAIESVVTGSKPAVMFKRIGTDGGDGWDLRSYNSGNNLSIDGSKLIVKIDDLEDGTTVRLIIPANSIQLTGTPSVQNPEIVRYFTVKKTNEPEVKLIYPSSVASVATSIVVAAKRSDDQNEGVNDNYPVTGVLKGPGISATGMEITAIFDNNNIVFKPTSALNPNSTYTLEIEENQIFMKGTPEQKVTKKKEFIFTTGASSGEVPTVIAKTPNDGVEVSVGDGTISFTFDQDVTIEPYSRVAAIPINGSESTCDAMSRDKDSESSWLLKKLIDGNDRVVGFTYGSDGLKYDMYYEVVLHANTVTGSGGKANERTTIRFKVKPASGYYSGDPDNYNFRTKEGYPYTWDLSVMNQSDIDNIKTLWRDMGGDSYCRHNQNNCYGMELSSTYDSYNKMDDLRGLRITQTKKGTNSHVKFLDLSKSTRCLRLHGNTNYMCIPNVPASEDNVNGEHLLYIDANLSSNGVFALNCPSEMAEWVGDAPKGTDGRKVYKIRIKKNTLTEDGFAAYSETLGRDIPLVCSDVNIYKIAYSTYNKTLTLGGEGYATDAHNYNISENDQTSNIASTAPKGVDYAMTKSLADKTVTPYYVTDVASGGDDQTPGTVTLTQVSGGVTPGQGTVLIGTAGETFPVFVKAYSKTNSETSANWLTGVASGSVKLNQIDGGNYFYVLYNQPIKVADDENETQIGTGSGMGFYLIHKTTQIEMQAHSAYLIINRKINQGGGVSTGSAAREVYFFKFEDENGNDLTGISTIEADGIKESTTNGDGLYYDLRGQRHVHPTKPGLYIHNGKKTYLK